MSLPSLALDAFFAVARAGSFSKASLELHITQSALSQRVMNLEDELQVSLFVREPRSLRLTAAGERLLRYVQLKEKLEAEVLSALMGDEISGEVRLVSLSSLVRSRILPVIAEVQGKVPGLNVEVYTREYSQIEGMLISGEVDMAITYKPLQRKGWAYKKIGTEKNVLIEPLKKNFPASTFIDHNVEDQTTHRFFEIQKKKPKDYQRIFLDDVYAIIDGVSLGMGRAIMPEHLIEKNKKINKPSGYRALVDELFLVYPESSYYSSLTNQLLSRFERGI